MRGNDVALAGNIYPRGGEKGDPLELRYSAGGTAFMHFNLSCYSHKDKDDESNVYTSYKATVFGDLAENIAESLEPGDSVIAFGRIQANNWTDDDGNRHYDQQVLIDELGPTLRWGTVDVKRTKREGGSRKGSGGKGAQARDDYGPDEAPF